MNERDLIRSISCWIKDRVKESNTRGVVVGLSGGVDSSVVLALAKHAVGDAVTGVIMPCGSSPEDAEHATEVAGVFGVETITVPLEGAFGALMDVLPVGGDVLAEANVKERLRMTALYYVANLRSFLVAGTGNRSELTVGYFTKYGDGGADILPIGGILKSDVMKLAKALGVPDAVTEKPPSAGLWEGQTDEQEMGIDYPTLDGIIAALDCGREPSAPSELKKRVRSLQLRNEHKLKTPPVFYP